MNYINSNKKRIGRKPILARNSNRNFRKIKGNQRLKVGKGNQARNLGNGGGQSPPDVKRPDSGYTINYRLSDSDKKYLEDSLPGVKKFRYLDKSVKNEHFIMHEASNIAFSTIWRKHKNDKMLVNSHSGYCDRKNVTLWFNTDDPNKLVKMKDIKTKNPPLEGRHTDSLCAALRI